RERSATGSRRPPDRSWTVRSKRERGSGADTELEPANAAVRRRNERALLAAYGNRSSPRVWARARHGRTGPAPERIAAAVAAPFGPALRCIRFVGSRRSRPSSARTTAAPLPPWPPPRTPDLARCPVRLSTRGPTGRFLQRRGQCGAHFHRVRRIRGLERQQTLRQPAQLFPRPVPRFVQRAPPHLRTPP